MSTAGQDAGEGECGGVGGSLQGEPDLGGAPCLSSWKQLLHLTGSGLLPGVGTGRETVSSASGMHASLHRVPSRLSGGYQGEPMSAPGFTEKGRQEMRE